MKYAHRVRLNKKPHNGSFPKYDPLKKDYTECKWFDMGEGKYEAMCFGSKYYSINQAYKFLPRDFSLMFGGEAIYFVVAIEEE